jgi:hypothetical protein
LTTVVDMKNQKGQALIELIIFLPLLVTLYSVIGGFASAINGSINQQKITRSYFYYRAQNNSTIPSPRSTRSKWKTFGMFFIGWRDQFKGGEIPVMPCFKITIPFKEDPGDKCEDAYNDTKTLWVRVGTVYGLCGATYLNSDNKTFTVPDGNGLDFNQVSDKSSCIITE